MISHVLYADSGRYADALISFMGIYVSHSVVDETFVSNGIYLETQHRITNTNTKCNMMQRKQIQKWFADLADN